jgi:penicillin amidase
MARRLTALLAVSLMAALLSLPSTVSAEEGQQQITIVRDSYGVPHVFGPTAEAVSYGAGYALAQDRLWQMFVFGKIAHGELSDLLGPIPDVVDIDRTVRFYTYTEQERAARFATYPDDIRQQLRSFVDGVNAWIDEVHSDPSKMPFEFAEYGVGPVPAWTVDDSVALADVLILAFGSGGGNEIANAVLLTKLVDELGEEKGTAAFNDLVLTDDPDDPVSIPRKFKWRRSSTYARVDDAESRRALTPDARLAMQAASTEAAAQPAAAAKGTLAQLDLIPDVTAAENGLAPIARGLKSLQRVFHFGSNAQIVGPRRSETGNTLQTGGPQVGYLIPQWLADFGLHSADGRLDAMGMTFAGVGPAVLIGRGPGFAWTTTTGSSDLTDTYVEQLNPDDDHEYLFDGEYEPMDCRTETYTFRGAPFDQEEICRTRHGPVVAIDGDNHVAYSLRYSWFNREGQTVEGFFRYNSVKSLEDFATDANYLSSNHNMFYVDDQGNYGYWTPGNHVQRAPGIDIRLPQDGTGGSEWQGLVPIQGVPHAVNFHRSWLANWNNQPAPGWERERAWDARDNVDDVMLAYRDGGVGDPDGGLVNPDPVWDWNDLSANLRYAAEHDHDVTWFRSAYPSANEVNGDLAKEALGVLQEWDGFLLDRNDDGSYDSAGVTILDRWLDDLRLNVFQDDLGDLVGEGAEDPWVRTESELWHVVSPDSTLDLQYDWLNGKSARDAAAASFEQAVTELAEEYGSDDPSTWLSDTKYEHYQRLNADLFEDTGADMFCSEAGCEQQRKDDSGFPGDIPEHIEMDRGTYNHVVAYLDPPSGSTAIGDSRSKAGSVIPPGQSGFIDLAGQEGPHYEDQLALYEEWRYKPMPLTLTAAVRLSESVTTLAYPG